MRSENLPVAWPPAARGRRQPGQLVDVVSAQCAAAAVSVPGAAAGAPP
jgi:hypothetical protein